MIQYHDILRRVLAQGVQTCDRTGVGTLSVFGHQSRYDLDPDAPGVLASQIESPQSIGFPVLTTKKLHLRSIIHELLWFLRGETNIRSLNDAGVKIWDDWADDQGELGPVYGHQWRSWTCPNGQSLDQIKSLITNINDNPFSRRHIVTAWNPSEIDQMALPPCHCLFQFHVAQSVDGGPNWLSCQLYQRSADLFLGVPFNVASYTLLLMMVAKVTGLRPASFIHTLGDAHIYINHLPQVEEQLSRECRTLPTMKITRDVDSIFDFSFEDFELLGYDPHPHIKGAVAV